MPQSTDEQCGPRCCAWRVAACPASAPMLPLPGIALIFQKVTSISQPPGTMNFVAVDQYEIGNLLQFGATSICSAPWPRPGGEQPQSGSNRPGCRREPLAGMDCPLRLHPPEDASLPLSRSRIVPTVFRCSCRDRSLYPSSKWQGILHPTGVRRPRPAALAEGDSLA